MKSKQLTDEPILIPKSRLPQPQSNIKEHVLPPRDNTNTLRFSRPNSMSIEIRKNDHKFYSFNNYLQKIIHQIEH